jgi:hypothetical protein
VADFGRRRAIATSALIPCLALLARWPRGARRSRWSQGARHAWRSFGSSRSGGAGWPGRSLRADRSNRPLRSRRSCWSRGSCRALWSGGSCRSLPPAARHQSLDALAASLNLQNASGGILLALPAECPVRPGIQLDAAARADLHNDPRSARLDTAADPKAPARDLSALNSDSSGSGADGESGRESGHQCSSDTHCRPLVIYTGGV